MQTAFHILSLVNELQSEIVDGNIVSTEFFKKERAAYLFIKKNKTTNALGFVFHPSGFGTFLVPASKIKLDTREKPWPFFELIDGVITDVKQFGFDRIFEITIEKNKTKHRVIFESIGPNGNLWLLDSDGQIKATLRKREVNKNQKYEPPKMPDSLSPLEVSVKTLKERISESGSTSLFYFIQKNLFGYNKTLAKEIIKRANLESDELSDLSDKELEQLVDSIEETVKLFQNAETGYMYSIKGGIEVYPFKLSSVEKQPEKFKSLSFAVMEMTKRRQVAVEENEEEKTITDSVKRAVKRAQKKISKIESDLEHAQDFEKYKKLGELIQINLSSIKKGMTEITVDDIYAGDEQITIKLEPAMTPAENAEAYFKKHRKAREGLEQMQRRLEISKLELENLKEISTALDTDYENAKQRFSAEIADILPKEGAKSEAYVRLPYKEYELSTGAKIFVGRDGADNDRTTFEFAKPYELWFHTAQCAGSHTVLKYPHKKFEPSKREIEETAAIAAWFSKARNDSLVPVSYTHRKYVRKPRKAKPGLVTIEREKSVMVVPKKPEE